MLHSSTVLSKWCRQFSHYLAYQRQIRKSKPTNKQTENITFAEVINTIRQWTTWTPLNAGDKETQRHLVHIALWHWGLCEDSTHSVYHMFHWHLTNFLVPHTGKALIQRHQLSSNIVCFIKAALHQFYTRKFDSSSWRILERDLNNIFCGSASKSLKNNWNDVRVITGWSCRMHIFNRKPMLQSERVDYESVGRCIMESVRSRIFGVWAMLGTKRQDRSQENSPLPHFWPPLLNFAATRLYVGQTILTILYIIYYILHLFLYIKFDYNAKLTH